jgi:hypothetical protein
VFINDRKAPVTSVNIIQKYEKCFKGIDKEQQIG